jgi:hypothetical protein
MQENQKVWEKMIWLGVQKKKKQQQRRVGGFAVSTKSLISFMQNL